MTDCSRENKTYLHSTLRIHVIVSIELRNERVENVTHVGVPNK